MRFITFMIPFTVLTLNGVKQEDIASGGLPTSYNTCPCKKPPGSNECISYPAQYAAATMDEVVLNFADTTAYDASKAKNILGLEPAYKTVTGLLKCDTKDCLACYQAVAQRVLKSLTDNVTTVATGLTSSLGLNNTVTSLLQGLNLTSSLLGATESPTCKLLPNTDSINSNSTTTSRPTYLRTFDMQFLKNLNDRRHGKNGWDPHSRGKRQSDSSTLGTSTPLTCDYKKGQPTDGRTNYCGLCNYCWSIRTLPDNYFPRYINERTCDQSDTRCLSGYGTCREIYRSIDVLYNTGTADAPKWEQYSINTPVSCDCQVQKDSAMYNFASA